MKLTIDLGRIAHGEGSAPASKLSFVGVKSKTWETGEIA